MSPKRITSVVLTVALLAFPAVAFALAGVAPPKAGRWKLDIAGGFSVSKTRTSVSGFHAAGASCGLAKNVVVKATLKLRTTASGGAANYIVGFGDPSRKSKFDAHGVVGEKVTVLSGPKKLAGRLDMVFAVAGDARDNSGDLIINGCDIFFQAHHL